MARARGGTVAYVVALVIFGVLFVFSLMAAIVFYTQITKHRLAEKDARDALARFATTAQINSPDYKELVENARTDNTTVTAMLLEDIRWLRQRITGSQAGSRSTVATELQTLNVSDEQTLVREIRRLLAEKDASQKEADAARAEVATAVTRADTAEAAKAQLESGYKSAVDTLAQQLASAQAQFAAYQQQVQQAEQSAQQLLQQVRDQGQTQLAELRTELESKEQTINDLNRRLLALQGPVAGTTQLSNRLDPDGRIVSIISEQNLVYIDRGLGNQLTLGMTFEVFDRNQNVTLDDAGELRGKATVEIINIADTSAVARVVRLEERSSINTGDQIVNLVYDPNTKLKFFVHGDFDIDNTGSFSRSDRERIQAMVSRFGGTLASGATLPTDVDYLVIGNEPEEPEQTDSIDPLVIQARAMQQKAVDDYRALVAEAKRLSIPILNQNRFLSMVGYYRR